MEAVAAILDFHFGTISAIFDLEVILLLHYKFQLNRPKVKEEKLKFGFQDGGYGGHFGIAVSIILATFYLHVNLLLHPKFQLNLPCGLRENVENRLSR